MSAFRAAILTLSDKGARGERMDSSGAAVRELISAAGGTVTHYEVIPDDRTAIEATLRAWCDAGTTDVIITTGGTGLSPRDVTPEATTAVLNYAVPGITEAMRAEGLRHTPMSMLSRAVAGVRARTLIINLPGSERGVRENLAVVMPVLAHAVATLRGPVEHG